MVWAFLSIFISDAGNLYMGTIQKPAKQVCIHRLSCYNSSVSGILKISHKGNGYAKSRDWFIFDTLHGMY